METTRQRVFNVAGPCNAGWQSGKTTCLQDIVQRLNAEGKYYALYCTLEKLQG